VTTEKQDSKEPAKGHASAPAAGAAGQYMIPASSPWAGAWKVAAGVGALGLAIAGWGFTVDRQRFAFSYLFGFFIALSLGLGSIFFVLVLHVTKAAWGVTVRRVAEFFIRPMYVFAFLVIPLVLSLTQLFPWMGAKTHVTEDSSAAQEHAEGKPESPLAEERGISEREPAAYRDVPVPDRKRMERAEEGAENEIVEHKHFFFQKWFFFGRLFFYLGVWYWIGARLFQLSTDQDKTKALENTRIAQSFAPVGLILFALTTTFFAFDWLLSLDPTWYSTMFGVQVFAQCALVQIATLIIVTLMMRKSGLLGDTVNVEHYHDLGKLLFGWIVFWSYVTFAQFFLTWYSNIPDELVWFHKRWHDNGGTWKGTSLLIVVMHFFVPFWFMLSRNIKRTLPALAAGAICMIVMHVIEVYWVVMPNYGPLEIHAMDLGTLIGPLGVYLAAVLRGMVDYSVVAVGDPRLNRALEFENA
jgi:hypothetical protein